MFEDFNANGKFDTTTTIANDNPATPTNFNYRAMGAGDTLRAFINTPGDLSSGWTLENDGAGPAGQGGTTAQKDGQGPGGGEFYYQDNLPGSHDELGNGGVAQIPGFPDVIITTTDPSRSYNYVRSGGIRWFNDTTGGNDKAYLLYVQTPSGNDTSTFGKANGVGDLIALAPPGPVEIGNRVFQDTNGNGLQDPGEPGIAGVRVDLYAPDGTTKLAQAVTDSSGDYYFSSASGTSTSSTICNVSGLTPDTAGYIVRIDNANFSSTSGGKLVGMAPSPANVGSDPTIDSNGVLVNGIVQATVTTPDPSAADHTIDFGYYQPVKIGDFVWDDTNGNGIQDPGEPGLQGVTLTLTGTTGAGVSVSRTTSTDANGHYSFSEPPGTYTVAVTTPSGYVPTVTGQGTPATDSNPSPSGTTPGTLPSGGVDNTVDFGFTAVASLSGHVYVDTNRDGVRDAGDGALPGVTLTLEACRRPRVRPASSGGVGVPALAGFRQTG